MTGLGLFFGIVLAVAYRFLRVPGDPRIEQVEEFLPGSNCGACGQPGCRGFAEHIVAGTEQPSGCTVASQDIIEMIADYLDVEPGRQKKRVARLHCAGGKGNFVHPNYLAIKEKHLPRFRFVVYGLSGYPLRAADIVALNVLTVIRIVIENSQMNKLMK